MLRPHSQPLYLFSACLTLAAIAGCGEPSADLDDSSSGGATMTGGSASGGVPLTGGTSGTGGAAASGGSVATGGVPGGGSGGDSGGASTGGAPGGTNGSGGASGGAVGSGGEGGDPSSGGSTGGDSGAGGSSGGAPSACPTVPALTGGTEYCSNTKGTIPSSPFGFELWAEGSGSGCMKVHGSDGAFSATWTDVDDFLARVGLDFNQTQTHSQIGNIKAEFAATKEEEGGGFTYIGVYGWTVNPLREFYILEDWGSVMPGGFSSDGTPRDEVGTLVADGETYDVWKKTRVDKPAITGDSETFDQYFSIRRTARQCGTISVSDHFSQWEALGEPLGNLHEVKLLLESQYNSGSVQFTTARVYVE